MLTIHHHKTTHKGWVSIKTSSPNQWLSVFAFKLISLGIPQRRVWLKPLKDLMSSLLIFHRLLTKWWREWWPLKQQRDGHKNRQTHLFVYPLSPIIWKDMMHFQAYYCTFGFDLTMITNKSAKVSSTSLVSKKKKKYIKTFQVLPPTSLHNGLA